MLIPFENNKVRVTQAFKYGTHNGMDLVGVDTWQLVAIGDGIIRTAVNLDVHYTEPLSYDRTREWGTYVRLDLNDGTICYYCHMQPGSLKVHAGQYVTKGDPIGTMGNSGYSFGAHCHFEIRNRWNGVTPDTNTATYTKIPNEVGVYEEEEDEEMIEELKAEIDELKKECADLRATNNYLMERCEVKYAWLDGKRDVVPDWAKDDITYIYRKKFLKGTNTGSLELSYIELRNMAVLSRAVQALEKRIEALEKKIKEG